MPLIEALSYSGTLPGGGFTTPVIDVSTYQHLRFTIDSTNDVTYSFNWAINDPADYNITETYTFTAGGEAVSQHIPVKTKWLSITAILTFNPQTIKFSSLFHEGPMSLASLINIGPGYALYKEGELAIRTLTSQNGSVTMVQSPTTLDLAAVSNTVSAATSDVQVALVGSNYSVGIGRVAANSNLRITLGSGVLPGIQNSVEGVFMGQYAGNTMAGANCGNYCVALGNYSMYDTVSSYSTTALGHGAARQYPGYQCTMVGRDAGAASCSNNCTGVGYQAGNDHQGNRSTGVGALAGRYYQGGQALAVGYGAGETTQGQYATALGYQAAPANQPNYSVAIGAGCASPGAVGRLAFGSGMEVPITPTNVSKQVINRLIPIEWNGVQYRIPVLAATATDIVGDASYSGYTPVYATVGSYTVTGFADQIGVMDVNLNTETLVHPNMTFNAAANTLTSNTVGTFTFNSYLNTGTRTPTVWRIELHKNGVVQDFVVVNSNPAAPWNVTFPGQAAIIGDVFKWVLVLSNFNDVGVGSYCTVVS